MKCGRGPEQGTNVCPAVSDPSFDGINDGVHGGGSCWLVAGTACKGKASGSFAKENDIIPLATDGLYKMATHDVMVTILNHDDTLKQKITALKEAALSSGGKDNITITIEAC